MHKQLKTSYKYRERNRILWRIAEGTGHWSERYGIKLCTSGVPVLRCEQNCFWFIPLLVTFWEHISRTWSQKKLSNKFFGVGARRQFGTVALVLLPSYARGPNKFIFVSTGKYWTLNTIIQTRKEFQRPLWVPLLIKKPPLTRWTVWLCGSYYAVSGSTANSWPHGRKHCIQMHVVVLTLVVWYRSRTGSR